MGERIYELRDIHMNRPSIILNALKYIDQRPLLGLVKRRSEYPRKDLVPLVELAIGLGAVRAIRARLPNDEVFTLVDLDSFPHEFDEFVRDIRKGKYGLDSSSIGVVLDGGNQRESEGERNCKQLITRYKRRVLRHAVSSRRFLPIAERFCQRLEQYVHLTHLGPFSPTQNTEEICGLLNLLIRIRPKDVLEIGTGRGGTLYLFTKVADPTATLVSVDLHIKNRDLLISFGRNKQRVVLIEGDSTLADTIATVERMFPNGVDFLFLDGDHSYAGIRKDFDHYSSMLRPGGLIAFHDIVKDNATRYGVHTYGWSGDVPRFWEEVKLHYEHVEFVRDHSQDGGGIGVLFMPGAA